MNIQICRLHFDWAGSGDLTFRPQQALFTSLTGEVAYCRLYIAHTCATRTAGLCTKLTVH